MKKDRNKPVYSSTTSSIKVSVDPVYLDDQSDPEDFHYVWAYHVKIENLGEDTVQLLRRHWNITDSKGRTQEVRGEGVVGEQPRLKPGQGFRYTSGAVLETPVGTMQGSYQMVGQDGSQFDAQIPVFRLAVPHALH